jgi:hypothetical protein
LKKGLIPTAPKAWADDKDAQATGQRSRAAYGGIYFASNPRVAFSSVHKPRGNDDSQYPVIIVATIQPRAALPDEDDFTFDIDFAFSRATKTAENPAVTGYYYIGQYLDDFQEPGHREAAYTQFADALSGVLLRKGVTVPMAELRKLSDPLFDAEVKRRASTMKSDQYGSYGFKQYVTNRALDHLKFHVGKKTATVEDLPPQLREQPSYDSGEADFRAALEALMRRAKRAAIGEKDAFRHTLRVMEPVTYSGRNRITAVVSLPDYYSRSSGQPITVVSHFGDPKPVLDYLAEQGYDDVRVLKPGQRVNPS